MAKAIFDKVLIANRGEVACRVMKTCKRLGIRTVAVYSTADEQSKHTKMADEAICIGPPTSAESYLRIDKIVDACIRTGAQAVHPGYGFLSEDSDLQRALHKNNIIFVGPDAHSIQAMGNKIESKRLATEAGLTCIPGFIGEVKSHEELLKYAREMGFPVMIKAVEGGGGKGMRIARNDKECVHLFDLCKEEAKAVFNNDKIFVEKLIENSRHIEIQIIADRKGNTLYLPERECSIQRRNQKVIEEGLSTLLDAKTRKAMGEEAVAMARAVQYVSAGTVENLVDSQRQFYFLEMNTRLQVEHPITEAITCVDIVEQMLRAAAGLPLSITQDDIKINGHCTECRIYAEDPTRNYSPSIGRVSLYQEPQGKGVRCDSGVVEGSHISVHYDPLLCKVSAWGKDRTESLKRMERALDEYVICGLHHNICLLRDVIAKPRYVSGNITTNFLSEEYPNGFIQASLDIKEWEAMITAAACVHFKRELSFYTTAPASREGLFYISIGAKQEKETPIYVRHLNEKKFEVGNSAAGPFRTIFIDWTVNFSIIRYYDGNEAYTLQYRDTDNITYAIQMKGTIFHINVLSELQSRLNRLMPEGAMDTNAKEVHSPMPGVISSIKVNTGDKVVVGAELLTLESMKMRNKIYTQVNGTVRKVKVKIGDMVDSSDILVVFE